MVLIGITFLNSIISNPRKIQDGFARCYRSRQLLRRPPWLVMVSGIFP
ncbi:hypothetical protein SAMN05720354_10744 [Nitrosospira sp. Nsp1]|nr:hypothetical protein SAMN05720354_10744 [Nitrosospira sp. Nsp1]